MSSRTSFHLDKGQITLDRDTVSRTNNNAVTLEFNASPAVGAPHCYGVTFFGLDDATADAFAAVTQLNEEGRAKLVKYANGLLSRHGDKYANN